MDPISAAASIVGLLGAGAKISSVIMSCVSHGRAIPHLAKNVIMEVNEISACLNQIQSFILDPKGIPRSHQELLMVDEVIVVLSNCVKIFSELEEEVDSLKPDEPLQPGKFVKWAWKERTVSRLLDRMQSCKMTLNLMISTLTCNSINDAQASVNQLTSLVTDILKSNWEISQRLAQMEARLSVRDSSSTRTSRQSMIEDSASSIRTETQSIRRRSSYARQMVKFGFAFDNDLRNSRPYTRVGWRSDKWSLASSVVQSTGPSFFSGLSLADISNLSVFNLAISRSDLWNANHYEQSEQAPEKGSRLPKSRLLDLFTRSRSTSDIASGRIERQQSQKIGLLGISYSGKSTICRHLELMYGSGFCSIERQVLRDIVINNLIDEFHKVLFELKTVEVESSPLEYHRAKEYLRDLKSDNNKICHNALKGLWDLKSVQLAVQEDSQRSAINDRFLAHMGRLDELFMPPPDYLSNDFILGLQQKTTGSYSAILQLGEKNFQIIDVSGRRCERKKWGLLESNKIIFVVSLTGYCENLDEDEGQNQMLESIQLFEWMTGSNFYGTLPIIVLFNKLDILSSKLKQNPISATFPDFRGENNSQAALHYFESLFRERDKRKLSVQKALPLRFHATSAIDTQGFRYTTGQIRDFLISNHVARDDTTFDPATSLPLSVPSKEFQINDESLEGESMLRLATTEQDDTPSIQTESDQPNDESLEWASGVRLATTEQGHTLSIRRQSGEYDPSPVL